MRIALASLHPRRLSGQVDSLIALARELERLGHAVRLVTPFEPGDLLRPGRVKPASQERGASAGGKLAGMLLGATRLARVGSEVDLIHLNLPTAAFSWLADLLRLQPGRPPIVVGFEAHLSEVGRLLGQRYLAQDPRFYLPLALVNNGLWGRLGPHRCQRYLVASRWQQQELRALGVDARRIVSLPNLIDLDKLAHAEPTADGWSGRLAGGASGPLIGWAGHLHHVKGVDVLLEAFARFGQRHPTARLALAWSGIGAVGRVNRQIRRLGLEQRVVRLGRVEVRPFFAALDVLALPYRLSMGQGAFPNIVLEAMQVGVPLVTSDLPLLRELVQTERTGLLIPVDDPAALAAGLERLLDDRALAGKMVAAQRTLMAGPLSAATLARRYVELYREVLAEVPAARRGAGRAG